MRTPPPSDGPRARQPPGLPPLNSARLDAHPGEHGEVEEILLALPAAVAGLVRGRLVLLLGAAPRAPSAAGTTSLVRLRGLSLLLRKGGLLLLLHLLLLHRLVRLHRLGGGFVSPAGFLLLIQIFLIL